MKFIRFIVCILSVFFLVSCNKTSVKRIDNGDIVDFSGYWNSTDSRLVAETMIRESVDHPWVHEYMQKKEKKPVVVVGLVHNKTAEHINTETFIKELERAFINSSNIKVVAGVTQRPELREEVRRMQDNASPETMKKVRNETGADYMLMGVVNDIVDAQGRSKVQFYQVNLELIHLESHIKAWVGQKKISKVIKKKRFGIF